MDKDLDLNLSPAVIVIFGITGDLAGRKLLPSLYRLEKAGLLHDKTKIVGVIRRTYEISTLLDAVKDSIHDDNEQVSSKALESLSKKLVLYTLNAAQPDGYGEFKDYLDRLEDKAGVCMNQLFYLAIPPQISAPIIKNLGENGLNKGCTRHARASCLLMEKPFGFDTNTAQELIDITTKYFIEDQIFRIDHYLAKETVQNLVTFRFRNPIFEDIWDCSHIKSITITADEKLDIEGRANFYEQTGALRDLVQSHLLHVMSVIMMDRPQDINDSVSIHQERQKVLDAIQTIPRDQVSQYAIRGQYNGYKDEVSNPNSLVETFVALKLYSHESRWQNVPIYIRTGKALSAKQTCITVEFQPKNNDHDHYNILRFYIQPNEAISLELWVKKPGFERKLEKTEMQFSYSQVFNTHGHPDAYERVLVDAIRGDNTLFATSDEVMSSWRILQSILDVWSSNDTELLSYAKGSNGPDTSSIL